MTRVAAIFALVAMAATPAAAGCQTVSDLVADLRGRLPARAYVAEVSSSVTPTVLAWLESEGLPHRATRLVQIAGDRGVALVLVEGERACDGTAAIELIGTQAVELARLGRRFREMRGYGPELPA